MSRQASRRIDIASPILLGLVDLIFHRERNNVVFQLFFPGEGGILLCNNKEVEREVESFVRSIGMGDYCIGVVDGCEVVLQFSPKGGLHFLGMVDLLQDV